MCILLYPDYTQPSSRPLIFTSLSHFPSNLVFIGMASKQRLTRKYREDVRDLALAQSLTSSRSKVFIAIDVKWDETDPDSLLEIGMAILDLREGHLRPNRFPPSTWSIRPRHIIINDNIHVHNKHARSNKFGFKFGKPYFARLPRAIESVQSTMDVYHSDQIVFVGQFLSRDIDRLEAAGIDFPEDMTWFDVANLDRAYEERVNGRRRGLADICEDLDIPYYRADKIGNAGNDAFFAMAVFAEMCCIEGEE